MNRMRRRAEQYMHGLLRKYVRRRKEMTKLGPISITLL